MGSLTSSTGFTDEGVHLLSAQMKDCVSSKSSIINLYLFTINTSRSIITPINSRCSNTKYNALNINKHNPFELYLIIYVSKKMRTYKKKKKKKKKIQRCSSARDGVVVS